MSYKASGEVERHTGKYEWEAMLDNQEGAFFVVSTRAYNGKLVPTTVIETAAEVARDHDQPVRLYLSHPTPGPRRRYVGKVTQEGSFQDARRSWP